VRALAEASGLPVGIYAQGAGGSALAAALSAAHAGAQLIACAIYPLALTLHRVSGEALTEALSGAGLSPGIDIDRLWEATDLVDEHIGDELVTPLVPRIAVLAARHDVPASVVAGIDHSLQAENAEDRLDEVLEELDRIRAETGWPPLASPIGQVLASQALLNVLSASRYITLVDEVRSLVTGAFGKPPAPIDPALERVVQLTADPESEEDVTPALDEVRERSGDIAASEEELLLLGLFGEDAERLLRGIRSRGRRDHESRMDENRAQRVQEIVRIVQESGIGEVTIEENGMRISVRSTPDLPAVTPGEASLAVPEPGEQATTAVSGTLLRVESPMVGTFYRSPQPGAQPFVEVGDVVGPGQTLCILEAMKLMNEVKAEVEGVLRAVHADDAQPVEFGQLLFELEPLLARPTL
jgi:oxaloacetate decarboxylase (Na+ extruding) subunit alpha